jgi:hypothetical protein
MSVRAPLAERESKSNCECMLPYKPIEEKAVLELFASLCADFPKGKLQQDESPDFVVQQGQGRKTGIELTKLFFTDGSPGQPSINRPVLSPAQVQDAIERKNNKYGHYLKKRLDEIWLILLLGFEIHAKHHQIDERVYTQAFDSRFHRLFLLDVIRKKLVELGRGSG